MSKAEFVQALGDGVHHLPHNKPLLVTAVILEEAPVAQYGCHLAT